MAPKSSDYSSSLQLVGLGGTGVNIIEAFIRNRKALIPLLQKEGVRISLLALDVADFDIRSLEVAYKALQDDLKEHAIPADKINLVAKTIKFPTPETMYDFIRHYPEFLEREGAKAPDDYVPWLTSSQEIPPLAGGVGRKRALSKGIYGLNYHHLKLVDGYMDIFKEHVFRSTIQPLVFVIYGLGGGTGSGIVLDFTRHLRAKLGSSIPIIGLGILPCGGDDPPAKGASAYAALLEHEAMLNRESNTALVKSYGDAYQNPFTALLMMPLGPAYSRTGSVVDARRLIDDAIVDVLMKSLNFDLADLLSNIGSNVDLGGKWTHLISTLKVSYPVAEFIELTKIYLDKLGKLRELRREKIEIYRGLSRTTDGGLSKVIFDCQEELKDVYKSLAIERNTYDESKFESDLANFITEGKSLESDLVMHLKGVEESIRFQINDLSRSVLSIGLDAPEGTVEAMIRKQVEETISLTTNISKTYQKFQNRVNDIAEDMRSSIPSSQQLTPRQVQILNDTVSLIELIDNYISGLRFYLQTNSLADKLNKQLAKVEKTEAHEVMSIKVQRILNPELVVNFALFSSLLYPISSELKTLDSRLSDSRVMKRVLSERLEKQRSDEEALEIKMKSRQMERERISGQIRKIRLGFFGTKKKYMESKLNDLDHEIAVIDAEMRVVVVERQRLESRFSEYSIIEKKFEVNSPYRKLVTDANDLSNTYYDRMSQTMKDQGYYDRVAELTEIEQMKIMQRILLEDEASLTDENILREIIDKKHLKEYLVGALGIFKIPETLGLTAYYRTDYIWFTVVSPRGIWDQDLDSETKAILSGYVKQDASKSIYLREVDSDDPWTMRFLIIAAKATPELLESFKEMMILYGQATPGEKILSHSFLLEQGVHVTRSGKLVPITMLDDRRTNP